ncbi:MAG: hypothetical protein ABI662_10285 [Dermatophilaceae bacterium]
MYGSLWRLLPGRWPVKALQCVMLVIGVVALCFLWLFPAIAPYMPFNDNTIATAPASPGSTTSAP